MAGCREGKNSSAGSESELGEAQPRPFVRCGWEWRVRTPPRVSGSRPGRSTPIQRPAEVKAEADQGLVVGVLGSTPEDTEKLPATCSALGRIQEQPRSEVKGELQQRAGAKRCSPREWGATGLPPGPRNGARPECHVAPSRCAFVLGTGIRRLEGFPGASPAPAREVWWSQLPQRLLAAHVGAQLA